MKIVGVSQRMEFLHERNETRDSLDQRLVEFISECGALAVPIPNILSGSKGALDQWLRVINPSAFVLSGGSDIGSCDMRDNLEQSLLNHASYNSMPVLGICRGMQMIGIWAGCKLKSIKGHVKTYHILRGRLEGRVNSYHGKSLMSTTSDFEILARSEDGEVEAISHVTLPWEGWMWHPEREKQFSPRDIDRLSELLS